MAERREEPEKEYEHDIAIEGLEEPELDVEFEEEEEGEPETPSAGDEDLSEEERAAESRKDEQQEELRALREELAAARRTGEETSALREEIRELKDQFAKQGKESEAASRKAEIDREMTELRKKLKEAKENGETDEELSIEDQLLDLRLEARELDRAPARKEPEPTAKETPSQREPQMPPAARDWLTRNRDWFQRPEHSGASAFAIAESKRLAASGYAPESERHYDELDKRLKAKFPELYGEKEEEDVDKRPPHGGSGNRGPQKPRNSGRNKVVLTARDKANMQRFKLDPDDPNDVKTYAREKAALERKEG